MDSAPATAQPADSVDGTIKYIRDVLQTTWEPNKQLHAIWIVAQKWAHNRLLHGQDRPAKHPH